MPALAHAQLVGAAARAAADRRALGPAARPAARRAAGAGRAISRPPSCSATRRPAPPTRTWPRRARPKCAAIRVVIKVGRAALRPGHRHGRCIRPCPGSSTTAIRSSARKRTCSVDSNEGFMTDAEVPLQPDGRLGQRGARRPARQRARGRSRRAPTRRARARTDPAWYIKGSEFDFDTGADEGVAHNGVLFFQGVPMFASPWLSFPLSGDRRSGLLPPTFSLSSSNGFEAVGAVLLQHRAESRPDGDAAPDLEARRADGRRPSVTCRPRTRARSPANSCRTTA